MRYPKVTQHPIHWYEEGLLPHSGPFVRLPILITPTTWDMSYHDASPQQGWVGIADAKLPRLHPGYRIAALPVARQQLFTWINGGGHEPKGKLGTQRKYIFFWLSTSEASMHVSHTPEYIHRHPTTETPQENTRIIMYVPLLGDPRINLYVMIVICDLSSRIVERGMRNAPVKFAVW